MIAKQIDDFNSFVSLMIGNIFLFFKNENLFFWLQFVTSKHLAFCLLCYLCLVFVMLSRLFIAALWSPAAKGLNSWLLFVMFNCVFVTFPCGILGQV